MLSLVGNEARADVRAEVFYGDGWLQVSMSVWAGDEIEGDLTVFGMSDPVYRSSPGVGGGVFWMVREVGIEVTAIRGVSVVMDIEDDVVEVRLSPEGMAPIHLRYLAPGRGPVVVRSGGAGPFEFQMIGRDFHLGGFWEVLSGDVRTVRGNWARSGALTVQHKPA